MMDRASFKTRARTVDHLGREQIADSPTAISELWKNAFDAYAKTVSLELFDSDSPVAVIADDGHGMSKTEFLDRWLVIGTESKATSEKVAQEDRNGLQERIKQGQKGIGRLSCAKLGPILLLISRRKACPLIASLIDWRLFENPFLNLADISIPTIEGNGLADVFDQLPEMIAILTQNIAPEKTSIEGNKGAKARVEIPEDAERIAKAWRDFDELPERTGGIDSATILNSIRSVRFSVDQLDLWKNEDDQDGHGTALMVAEVNYDLQAQLESEPFVQSVKRTRENFRETLASFIDPFVDPDDDRLPDFHSNFEYRVRVWKNGSPSVIVGNEKGISRRQVSEMEHSITGFVDEEGVFRGRIKAFGQWLPDKVEIVPATDVRIPTRVDTKLGPFEVHISTMEFDFGKSTHDKVEHDRFKEMAGLHAGFMIFRDGLRVLPYGRKDSDFFEIDDRRSRNAGREFWNQRQMFGRIAIERERNPNIKDKAGREGILDNRAAKALKDIGVNLLMQSARRYFGSASPIRKVVLPNIVDAKKKQRDAENRRKMREKNKTTFKRNLVESQEGLPKLLDELEADAEGIRIENDADITSAQERLAGLRDRLPSIIIPGAPRTMPPRQREKYSEYRNQAASARDLFAYISKDVNDRIEAFRPSDPLSVLEAQCEKSKNRILSKINEWQKLVRSLQTDEFGRIKALADLRKPIFRDEADAIIQLFKVGRETFGSASSKLAKIEFQLSEENKEIFEPYVRALESLKESIDLEHLATSGMEDLAEARAELDRLNSLAQLGIAVEITGHDLQDFDDIIASGLERLPKELAGSKAVNDIRVGYEGLTDQLRFLSPLRLSGTKVERWIEGEEIHQYISDFFAPTLRRNIIRFDASSEFRNMRVFDQPSRLLPVFINLVNNSIYWLGTSENEDRRILLEVSNDLVVLSDNGPGVPPEDIENLFKLFFTRKIHGGRGVGLYLSKANLVSGGHSITYITQPEGKILPGANFEIKFNGAEFNDERSL